MATNPYALGNGYSMGGDAKELGQPKQSYQDAQNMAQGMYNPDGSIRSSYMSGGPSQSAPQMAGRGGAGGNTAQGNIYGFAQSGGTGNTASNAPANGPATYGGPQGSANSTQSSPSSSSNSYMQGPAQNLGMGMPQSPQTQMPTPQAPQIQMPHAPTPQGYSGGSDANPYIASQAKALQDSANQNLQQNVLPGIGQGAQAAGMYGSSRQGTAEGQAMANSQTGIAAAQANLYGQSYQADQANKTSMANTATGAGASMYGAQMGLAGSMYGNQTQSSIAGMQNQTQQRGQDQSYGLGQGNLGLGYQNSNQQFQLGMGNLGVANKQADNTFALGQGQLNNQHTANQNQYDLGLRSNDLGFAGLDANINQSNFNNRMAGANFGMGVYDRMNGYNQQGTNNGTQMQNTPIGYQGQFGGMQNQIGGRAGSTTQTQGTSTNPLVEGMGLLGNGSGLRNAWNNWRTPANNDVVIPMQPGGGY